MAALVRDRLAPGQDGPAQGVAAGQRRAHRRLAHRPRAGRRRPHPGGGLHDHAAVGRARGFLRAELAQQLPSAWPATGVLLIDKPAGKTSHDVVAGVRRACRGRGRGEGRPRRHARPVRHRAAPRAGRPGHARPALLMDLPKTYETEARFGAVSTTGDPEGEITETGRVPEGDLALPTGRIRQRPPAYSAVKVGGQRAYGLARRGRGRRGARARGRGPRVPELWRDGEPPCLPHPLRSRDLRPLARGRPRRRLLHGAAPHGDRALRRSPTPTRAARRAGGRAGASCPRSSSAPRTRAPRGPRRRRCPARRRGRSGSSARRASSRWPSPRDDGTLKPVVGLVG